MSAIDKEVEEVTVTHYCSAHAGLLSVDRFHSSSQGPYMSSEVHGCAWVPIFRQPCLAFSRPGRAPSSTGPVTSSGPVHCQSGRSSTCRSLSTLWFLLSRDTASSLRACGLPGHVTGSTRLAGGGMLPGRSSRSVSLPRGLCIRPFELLADPSLVCFAHSSCLCQFCTVVCTCIYSNMELYCIVVL